MNKTPTYDELKNLGYSPDSYEISYLKGKESSHVFSDPYDFTYKFIKCTYNNRNRKFNHVEIGQEIFEDFPKQENSTISNAIIHLDKDKCWKCINPDYFLEINNCEKCKKISE